MKARICLLVFAIVFTAGEARPPKFHISPRAEGNAITLSWTNSNGQTLLSGLLGISLPSAVGSATDCAPEEADECHEYGDFAKLFITRKEDGCSRIEWKSTFARRLEDCFDLTDGAHWYGGGETYYQAWPIERETRREAAFVTGDSLAGEEYGSVAENYWLVSTGVSIRVDEEVPLFLSWRSVHENKVCFVAKYDYPYHLQNELTLRYDICAGENIKTIHQKSLQDNYIEKPTGLPDEVMLLRPFWSTWAQYKENVNQSIVLDFARRIKSEGFELSSHVEIDDDWESCYGEATFSTTKFPDPQAMVQELKAMDLRVTLWIHPFINLECPSFLTAVEGQYLVKDQKGKPGITSWWQGTHSGIVDYTNSAAADWWRARLELLRSQFGIDSFKFDAGETNWLPYSHQLTGDDARTPNLYTTKYVEALAPFGGMIEVRSGRRNQNLPIFTRMLDKDSKWGYDNGLQSLIPTLLHFGIVGYPFVLPDMIGGNAYGDKPSAELYVRWMQANAFMPSVQFSIVPWDYDSSVVQICKDVLVLREQYKDNIYAAANQAVSDGTPINRPIWWVDPTDPETFMIDNQYMLGDDILVAPVVVEGAVVRDIYLPQGTWEAPDGTVHEGPLRLVDYPAPLEVLPYFVKSSAKI